MPDTPLFDGWPEAERTETIPVTLDLWIRQFVKRWGYSQSAQDGMKVELEELIEFATREK